MSDLIPFMKPRLDGKRFEKHSIPLEMFRDLAVLEEMVIEVAKWRFRKQHPERSRAPRGFADGISIDLTGVDEGSAIPLIALLAANSGLFPHSNLEYFEQARDSIVAAVSAAENDEPITDKLPEEFLPYFDRLGRSLRDGEAFEFAPENTARPARLTKSTRRKLLLASPTVEEVTDEVTLRGSIPGIQQEKKTFDLHVLNGPTVSGVIPEFHRKEILEAVTGYENGVRVLLKGVGRFNRNSRLVSLDSVEDINILDPLDVPARLADLKSLKDGWLDGKGLAPVIVGLDWFAKTFEANFPDDLPLPFVYPTAEGGIQLEWSLDGQELSLEVDLNLHSGIWHSLNLQTQQDESKVITLEGEGDWKQLSMEIRRLAGGQQ